MKLMQYLAFFLLTISFYSNAYIYQITAYNNLCFFGDVHVGSNPKHCHPTLNNEALKSIHKKQACEIIDFVKQHGTKNSLVIVEDIFDCNYDDQSKQFYKQLKEDNLKQNFSCCLSFINDYCQENGIDIVNVEFRQIKNEFYALEDKINADQFLEHLDSMIEEVKNLDDGPILNDYYKEVFNDIYAKNKKYILLLKRNRDKYFHQFRDKLTHEEIETFDIEYSKLLNIKFLNLLNKHKDKNIFICVGAAHIQDVKQVLKKLEYKKISSKKYFDKDMFEKPVNIMLATIPFTKKMYNPFYIFIIMAVVILGIIVVLYHKFFIALTLVLLTSGYAQAYIHEIYADKNLYCFGDAHFGANPAYKHPEMKQAELINVNNSHCNQICDLVSELGKENSIVIVEDYLDCQNNNIDNRFFNSLKKISARNNDTSLPALVNDMCKAQGIKVINAEHRHKHFQCFDYAYSENLIVEFLEDFEKLINEIKHYDDSKILNDHYNAQINELMKNNKTFISYLKENQNKKGKEIQKELNAGDLQKFNKDYYKLLDLRLLHLIHIHREKNIIVCAGSSHIKRIQPVLFQQNYTQYEAQNFDLYKPVQTLIPKLVVQNNNYIFNYLFIALLTFLCGNFTTTVFRKVKQLNQSLA